MNIIPATYFKSLTKETNFSNHLSIVDTSYRISKLCGIEDITTEEVMYKLDMIQAIFVKADEFGWLDMEIIRTESGMHFTSKDFQEGLSVRGLQLALTEPNHQEMNVQVEVTWQTL